MDMWQTVLAGLIVLIAAAYTLWALMPSALRLRIVRRLVDASRRAGEPWWLVRSSAALERVARRGAGGCVDCRAARAEPRPKPRDKA
jgi:hypothetical protein